MFQGRRMWINPGGIQKYIRNKDHNPELELKYLQRLVEEVGELARAMRTNTRYHDTQNIKGRIDEELYDIHSTTLIVTHANTAVA